ncbi:MAG: O-antigen ligase family protein [Candidatus Moranbacteria bacterium]|nr:O-antigen ligase family protein [Candidatus Moranbacteria bacterium]
MLNISWLPLGWRQSRAVLLFGSMVGVFSFIILENKHVLPLTLTTFLFFSLVAFLLALYRPGWVFLLFVASIPLEVISVAPEVLGGVMLRPYQWLAVILLMAVAMRFVSGRLPFRLLQPRWFDVLPLLVALGGFLALLEAPVFAVSFKQALVVTSFVGVYFLGRIFFRTLFDVLQALPFFLVSSAVVLGYALWQNLRFLAEQESYQVMVGRPNATFAEADWLGMFVIVVLGAVSTLLFHFISQIVERGQNMVRSAGLVFMTLYLVSVYVILILTVARSAWLGASALFMTMIILSAWWYHGQKSRRSRMKITLFSCIMGASLLGAGVLVYDFHLSPFELGNRIQSTGSGLQNITVACENDRVLPERIATVDDLVALGCRHIDLKAVASEKEAGKFVQKILRDDPNVAIRRGIYEETFTLLKAHLFLGIGWGSASAFLGTDERGAGLNASNVLLEVWLGSGLIGMAAFVLWLGLIVYTSLRWYQETEEEGERLFVLFLFTTLAGMMVFNLFNSGILLGFFFLFLALGGLSLERWEEGRTKKEML